MVPEHAPFPPGDAGRLAGLNEHRRFDTSGSCSDGCHVSILKSHFLRVVHGKKKGIDPCRLGDGIGQFVEPAVVRIPAVIHTCRGREDQFDFRGLRRLPVFCRSGQGVFDRFDIHCGRGLLRRGALHAAVVQRGIPESLKGRRASRRKDLRSPSRLQVFEVFVRNLRPHISQARKQELFGLP